MKVFAPTVVCLLLASAAWAGTVMRLTTPVGSVDIELYDRERPITVQNFLTYVKKGRFTNSFSHRLMPNFVIQGGGFTLSGSQIFAVPTDAPIVNEFKKAPAFSNKKGTITMAKVEGDPNSATSQWFINLKDNNTGLAENGNLDLQNGGFTVFGRVISSDALLDVLNTDFADGNLTSRQVSNSSKKLGDVFSQLPLLATDLTAENLLFTNWTILSEEKPALTISGPLMIRTKKTSLPLKGTASPGVAAIEWRIGKTGKLTRTVAGTAWRLQVKGLRVGQNVVYVRAVTRSGGEGNFRVIQVRRD